MKLVPTPSTPLPPEKVRDVVANLYADEVLKIGSNDIPKAELTIEVTRTKDRSVHRIRCGPL